ncbi:hypothetical protein SLEP1_g34109 [Rubroshorea leprosula]|uniref:Uncharacterized protein n=1 Tax=Rubroshorea leprosula TaxID=152421 RepID=A0AAV5KIS7_9ROSI|nr:hypothetical protein SLEP1_g34109 [Rubroshorea leprosula]
MMAQTLKTRALRHHIQGPTSEGTVGPASELSPWARQGCFLAAAGIGQFFN